MRKFIRKKHAGSGLARAHTGCNFYFLSPQASAPLYLLEPASRGIFPSALKPDELARNVSIG
jgi:hypothetical protein